MSAASRVLSLAANVRSTATSAAAAAARPPTTATGPLARPPPPSVFPRGFRVGGVAAGIKKNGKPDIALVVAQPDRPCAAAGVFTTNAFPAAPVLVSRSLLARTGGNNVHVVVANAGCANACTGAQGMEAARIMSREATKAAAASGKNEDENALVLSTGVIGQQLPMEKVVAGIRACTVANHSQSSVAQSPHQQPIMGSDGAAWDRLAEAIMTTDTFPKLLSRRFELPDGAGSYVMAGVAKGAGMIHPNMATMLGVVCTDAPVDAASLAEVTRYAADRSFNAISVDGDTSTNDTLFVLANGASENCKPINSSTTSAAALAAFRSHLTTFCADLAKLIVRDGEGATKFVTVHIENAASFDDAKKIASSIATSSLVKTALFGEDANWGRILAAVGYAGVPVDPKKVHLYFKGSKDTLHLVQAGEPFDVNEERAKAIITEPEITIIVDLGMGKESATMWTCDLSYEYVRINGDYRS